MGISAVLKYNLEAVCEYLCTQVPVPIRDFTSAPHMMIIRSFDVNRPGEEVANLKGGVAGGSLLKGVLKVGDEIEIRPGIVSKDSKGSVVCRPIRSKIATLSSEQNALNFAVPGGLIGVGTIIDPFQTRQDRLIGHVLGYPRRCQGRQSREVEEGRDFDGEYRFHGCRWQDPRHKGRRHSKDHTHEPSVLERGRQGCCEPPDRKALAP